jgi:hypothetical protein
MLNYQRVSHSVGWETCNEYTGWWCNNHLEKYEFVNGVGIIPYMKWKKKCSKPPTRILLISDATVDRNITNIYWYHH